MSSSAFIWMKRFCWEGEELTEIPQSSNCDTSDTLRGIVEGARTACSGSGGATTDCWLFALPTARALRACGRACAAGFEVWLLINRTQSSNLNRATSGDHGISASIVAVCSAGRGAMWLNADERSMGPSRWGVEVKWMS